MEFTENYHVTSISTDKTRTFWSGKYQIKNDTLIIAIDLKSPHYIGGYHNISMNLPLDMKNYNQFIVKDRDGKEPLIGARVRLMYESGGEDSTKETSFGGESSFSHNFDHSVDSVIVEYLGYQDYRFKPPFDSLPRTFSIYLNSFEQSLIRPNQDVEIRKMIMQSTDTLRDDKYRMFNGKARFYVREN